MTTIPSDQTTQATIELEQSVRQVLDAASDSDAFRLIAPAGETVRIEVDVGPDSAIRPEIAILDADGDEIESGLDENADGLHYLLYEVPAEPVFVRVSDAGGSATGGYRLSVEDSLGRITIDATTDGAYDFDRFRTVLEAGRHYRAEVSGNTAFNTLTVDSPDVVSLSEAIFGPVATRFDLGFTARGDGRDFLLRGADLDERFTDFADYTLEISEIFDDAPDGPSTRASLALGETYRGRFETTADRDWIRLEIEPGTSVNLSADLGDRLNPLSVVAIDRATGALAQPVVTSPILTLGTQSLAISAEEGIDYFAVASIRTDVQVNQSRAYDLTTIALPGDVASGPSTGLSLAAEGTVQSFFEVIGDVDWIALETVPGQTYGYDIGSQGGITSQIVRIDSQTGAFLGASAAGEDSNFVGSSGSFTAEAGIDYFVQIQAGSRAVGLWEARLYAVEDDVADHTGTSASVVTGAVFSGIAGVNDISGELNGPDVDYIRLDVPAGQSHRVTVAGNVDAFVFSADDFPEQFSAGSLVLRRDDLPAFFRGAQDAIDFAEQTRAGFNPSDPETVVVTRELGETLFVAVQEGGLFDDIGGNQPYEVSVAPLPTDTPDNENTTAVIVPNSTVFGIYEDESDRDWVRIDIPVGESFALQQTGGGTFRVIAVDEATGEATERVPPTPPNGQVVIDGSEIGRQGYVTGVAGETLYAQAEGDGGNGNGEPYSFRLLPREDDITEAYAGAPAIGLVDRLGQGLSPDEARAVAYLYEAGLDRDGNIDLPGLNFWIDQREAGLTEQQLARAFLDSGEFEQAFGAPATLSDVELVEQLYLNVLDRPGEQAGVDFWVSVVGRADVSREDLLIAFAESPENLTGSAFVEALEEIGPGDWAFS